MRTLFAPGRRILTAPIFAVLTLMSFATATDQAVAGEDQRACLMGEADRWLGKLAVSIAAAEIDPATVDDAYITRESGPIVATCAGANGQPSPADEAQFRAYMARWSYHLDRKLQEITTRGASD